MTAKPNILLVMCDQLSALHTSPYGNAAVKTPNLQRLADRGVTFVNNYCNAPLCAPSRASLFSGRLASEIPVNDNAEELPAGTPTFVHHLRLGGYQTCLSGKMHFVGPDQLHGFEERLTTDIYPADFSWTQYWLDDDGPLRRTGNPSPGSSRSVQPAMANMVRDAGPVGWSAQLDYDEAVQFKALERIRKFARRRGDSAHRPWFLCVSFTQPHDPYAPDRAHWNLYDDVDIPMPETAPAGFHPHITDEWLNTWAGVDEVAPSDDDVYRTRRGYYGMISYVDDKLGELVDELDRNGFGDDTVIVFTSDHGDMVGEHGMFFKRTFREASSRVPLVVAGPGVASDMRVENESCLLDLYPTMVELGGLGLPDEAYVHRLGGESLVEVLQSGRPRVDRPVVIENFAEGTRVPTRSIVLDRWKYVFVLGHEELLYDLRSDPNEWSNLAADPAHAHTVARLRALCLEEWDPALAAADVIDSQRRRTLVRNALRIGEQTRWDFQPVEDAARMYVRTPFPYPADASWNDQADARAGGR